MFCDGSYWRKIRAYALGEAVQKDQEEMQCKDPEATKGMAKHAGRQSFTLTFLMSSEVIGFPFLSIAPSATMMMLRREPRVLVWARTGEKVVNKIKLMGRKWITHKIR